MQMNHEIKVGAFSYKLKMLVQTDGVVFDIIDNVIVKGNVMPDIICSGKIDKFGRCKLEAFCDLHAAFAMGEILKALYDKSAELMLDTE